MNNIPVRLRTRQIGGISTSRFKKNGGKVEEEISSTDKIPVPEDLKNPGYVMVKGSITKNMGDYNSVGVSVSISMPCRAVPEAIQACYEDCAATVDRLLDEQLRIATGQQEGATDVPSIV